MNPDTIIGRPIRLNRKKLTPARGKDYAEVLFIGDVHLGSPQCDVARFERMLDFAKKNRLYIFLMGDLIENANRSSIGAGVYEQEFIGQSQHERMVEYLRPLAEKRLILGSVTGNHESRTYLQTGVNVSKMLCRELDVPYLGDACWNRFQVGKQSYSVYTLHGRTGSRFDGTALLNLERISSSFTADLVAIGHSHKLVTSAVITQTVLGHRVVERKKHLLICGAYLRYDGGYGQVAGLPISKLGSPKVKFYANEHDLHVTW